ncbi:hypothetical protein ECG_05748 [Echinococcus granulosus]|uniref:Expressed conserved protein n=1 Tax=Echinococcus granulosus TaxID=6210 RepID=A0A068WM09_ECHGR|nr:hypothetical protein ECG_05748 [Echinococcus granulosus]CDS18672.1 expressed conserved protein [Echinococcus granulosus]
MRGPTLFLFCLLLVLLAVSTSGSRYVHHRKHNSLGVRNHHRKGYLYRHHGRGPEPYLVRRNADDSSLSSHLQYLQDTAGSDVDRTKAQQLAKQRSQRRRRYN